ncbi:MAG: 50S ribosomal protein L23 [Gammaproteobacteria bacterium RIFCSPHIGHO2_12_FULL_35_23]|nr:MAG: 50S ribosomal protein L23 [Gammaproteobacteria bacterium RIFCSPHIGHO2_12_FULL_35_23]
MKTERLMKVILAPLITEKTQLLAEKKKQFGFKVLPDATKPEIKKAIEELFKVKVKSVTVANVKGKVKRFGRHEGVRKDWKKAYVALEAGYDINYVAAES